jgi:uroporphyrinogen decarboxylase
MTELETAGKARILAALAGDQTDTVPVAIDYLRLYLAERTEHAYVAAYRERLQREGRVHLDPDEDVSIRASAILSAYDCFEEQQDWLQVFAGPSQEALNSRELVLDKGRVFELDHGAGARHQLLIGGEEAKTEEMRARFEEMDRRFQMLQSAGADSELARDILADYQRQRNRESGDFALVETLVRERGGEQFLYMGVPAPFCSLYGLVGFDGMMTALVEMPDLVVSMMDELLDGVLERAQAFKDSGGHGIRVEEYFASADIISPRMYERFALPYEERLLSGLRQMGLKSVLYFCGDVVPRLPALRQLPMDALMVEESKKDFHVDIGAVRARVGPELCLFGNVDSYGVVQTGTEAELEAEIARQIRVAGAAGAFIVGLGIPLPLDTPPARVDCLVRFARARRAADGSSPGSGGGPACV